LQKIRFFAKFASTVLGLVLVDIMCFNLFIFFLPPHCSKF